MWYFGQQATSIDLGTKQEKSVNCQQICLLNVVNIAVTLAIAGLKK